MDRWPEFVFYEKKYIDEEGNSRIERLRGIKGKTPDHLYLWLDINRFDDAETKVPNDFFPTDRPSQWWMDKYFYNPNKKRNIPVDALEDRAQGVTYFVHDNGGKPFMVCLRPNEVSIFRCPEDEYIWDEDAENWPDPHYYKQHLFTFKNPRRVWISEDYEWGKHGNSILIQADARRFIFVGIVIAEFILFEPVVASYSNLYGADVAYPVVLTKNYIVFPLKGWMYERSDFALETELEWADAYSLYYGHKPGMKEDAMLIPLNQYKIMVGRLTE